MSNDDYGNESQYESSGYEYDTTIWETPIKGTNDSEIFDLSHNWILSIIVVSYKCLNLFFFQASAPNALISDKLYVSEADNLWVEPTGSNFTNIKQVKINYKI